MRPRHYAAKIGALVSLAERKTALADVPEEFREIVKSHLRILFERKRFERDRGHVSGGSAGKAD